MELVYILLIMVGIFYFGSLVKKATKVVDHGLDTTIKTADIILELAEDTTGTYKHEVLLSNAQKRDKLVKKYNKMNQKTAISDLDKLAKSKRSKNQQNNQ